MELSETYTIWPSSHRSKNKKEQIKEFIDNPTVFLTHQSHSIFSEYIKHNIFLGSVPFIGQNETNPIVIWGSMPPEEDIKIDIDGHRFYLNANLPHIAVAISKSGNLLKLKDDWDDEGAMATDFNTLEKAIKFTIDYTTYIYNTFDKTILDTPSIEILNDGAIAVNWETDISSFTIIFTKDLSDIAYYYAKVKDVNIPPLKHKINISIPIDKITTAPWMAEYLKYKQEKKFQMGMFYIAGE